MNLDIESTVRTPVADGKGMLAADQTPGTLTRRFDALRELQLRRARGLAEVVEEAGVAT